MSNNQQGKDKERTVIITGSAGYIGKKLIQAVLASTSASVIGIDKMENDCIAPRLRTIRSDLSLPEGETIIHEMGDRLHDAAIIHLSGLFVKDVALSWQISPIEYERDNLITTQRLVNAVLQSGYRPALFVFSSTACVYDGAKIQPTPVEIAYPIAAYGESKLMAEAELKKLVGWVRSVVVLRLSRILGIGDADVLPQDIVSDFIEKMALADVANVSCLIGSGSEVRPYIHIEDVINIFLSLLKNWDQEGFIIRNVTSVNPIRVEQIGNIVGENLTKAGLLQNKLHLDIRSRVKTRVPILYPQPYQEFQPISDSSEDVVRQAARQYTILLKKLVDDSICPNLLTAVERARKPVLSL